MLWQNDSGEVAIWELSGPAVIAAAKLIRGAERWPYRRIRCDRIGAFDDLAMATHPSGELDKLAKIMEQKAEGWMDVVKIGRTHLEEAVPLSVGLEWSGWAAQIRACVAEVERSRVPSHESAGRANYEYAGGGTKPPISAASSRANSIVVGSSPSAPMIWQPTGRPAAVRPSGAAVAGR